MQTSKRRKEDGVGKPLANIKYSRSKFDEQAIYIVYPQATY